MNDDEQVYMVCLPDLPEYQNSRIPGCVKGHCVKCGRSIMVAPSTMKALRENHDRVTLCLFCYCGTEDAAVVRSVLRENVAAPTEAQLTEIAQNEGPEAAQKLREFFRQRDGN